MVSPAWPAGNEFLSVPHLDPRSGEIPEIVVVSERAGGPIALRGGRAPLLRVVCAHEDGTLHPFAAREAAREDAWTPALRGRAGGRDLTVRLVGPPDERALIIAIHAAHAGTYGLAWIWEGVTVTTAEARDAAADLRMAANPDDAVVSGEALGPLPILGWAIAADGPAAAVNLERAAGAWRGAMLRDAPAGAEIRFVVAAGADGPGARRTAMALRAGAAGRDAEARAWLQSRAVRLRDSSAEARTNLNLLFNRYYAAGRTLERGLPAGMTSRNPRHPECGVFRARDAFLWSVPGLCVLDPVWAGELLLDFYETTWPQGADNVLYASGAPMHPAADLAALCAYPVAYETAHDLGVDVFDDDDIIVEIMENFPVMLQRRLDEETGLYPTGRTEAGGRRFDTYPNVLAWRALEICAAWQDRMNRNGEETYDARSKSMAGALRWAIRRHCLAPSAKGASYSIAVTDSGDVITADDPSASILLLPYYGFCRASDAAWRNAVRAALSTRAPQWIAGKFGGVAAPGARFPSVVALCSQVLAGANEDALGMLTRAPLDDGLACEVLDPRTGASAGGSGNAALAGLLGYALWSALREETPREAATPP